MLHIELKIQSCQNHLLCLKNSLAILLKPILFRSKTFKKNVKVYRCAQAHMHKPGYGVGGGRGGEREGEGLTIGSKYERRVKSCLCRSSHEAFSTSFRGRAVSSDFAERKRAAVAINCINIELNN